MKESIQIHSLLGNQGGVAFTTQLLAFQIMHCGQYQQSQNYFETALSLYQEQDDQFGRGLCLENLGKIALTEKRYDEALKLGQESLSIFQKWDNELMLGFDLAYLACAERMLGDLPQARQYLNEALRLIIGMGSFLPLLETLSFASLLLADLGKAEQAVEIYALASSHPFVGNSQWFADIVGQEIKTIAATLAPEVVSAAEKRGQARDFWETAAELLAEIDILL